MFEWPFRLRPAPTSIFDRTRRYTVSYTRVRVVLHALAGRLGHDPQGLSRLRRPRESVVAQKEPPILGREDAKPDACAELALYRPAHRPVARRNMRRCRIARDEDDAAGQTSGEAGGRLRGDPRREEKERVLGALRGSIPAGRAGLRCDVPDVMPDIPDIHEVRCWRTRHRCRRRCRSAWASGLRWRGGRLWLRLLRVRGGASVRGRAQAGIARRQARWTGR